MAGWGGAVGWGTSQVDALTGLLRLRISCLCCECGGFGLIYWAEGSGLLDRAVRSGVATGPSGHAMRVGCVGLRIVIWVNEGRRTGVDCASRFG